MTRYQLKLSTGRVVEWAGATGEDAARRYVDAHRDETPTVVAYREADRYGLHVGTPGTVIE